MGGAYVGWNKSTDSDWLLWMERRLSVYSQIISNNNIGGAAQSSFWSLFMFFNCLEYQICILNMEFFLCSFHMSLPQAWGPHWVNNKRASPPQNWIWFRFHFRICSYPQKLHLFSQGHNNWSKNPPCSWKPVCGCLRKLLIRNGHLCCQSFLANSEALRSLGPNGVRRIGHDWRSGRGREPRF